MRILRGFGRFWYDFLIGDDPKIAVAVLVALALGALLVGLVKIPGTVVCPLVGALLLIAFLISFGVDTRRSRRN